MDLARLWMKLAEEWEKLDDLDRAREARTRAVEFRHRRLTSASPSAYEECAAKFDELFLAKDRAGRPCDKTGEISQKLTSYAAYLRLGCSPDVAEQVMNERYDVSEDVAWELRNAKLTEEEARALEVVAWDLDIPLVGKKD
jgi:hypothetical protein